MAKYSSRNAPRDRLVWGYAYSTNDNEKSMSLRKEPVLGVIKTEGGRYWKDEFYELKRNWKTLDDVKKSSKVYADSRSYADTLEEAIEGYNEKVLYQISKLEELITECKKDIIGGR